MLYCSFKKPIKLLIKERILSVWFFYLKQSDFKILCLFTRQMRWCWHFPLLTPEIILLLMCDRRFFSLFFWKLLAIITRPFKWSVVNFYADTLKSHVKDKYFEWFNNLIKGKKALKCWHSKPCSLIFTLWMIGGSAHIQDPVGGFPCP